MTRYSHRNGEPDTPTEPGWYEFTGTIKGVGVFIPYPMFILVGCEGGPSYADLKRKCKGRWYGPLIPPFHPDFLASRRKRLVFGSPEANAVLVRDRALRKEEKKDPAP